MEKNFDFVVLGDSQPEGLFLAAGLSRRAYKVGLISAEQLGELPSAVPWPTKYPEKIGEKRLDDLLFRVGFFRLEDSGLVGGPRNFQVLLPKHRLNFDGSLSGFERETRREFPIVSERLLNLRQNLRKEKVSQYSRSVSELRSLMRDSEDFRQWVESGAPEARPSLSEEKRFLSELNQCDLRTFRVGSQLSQSFQQFLIEHARKWGVHSYDGVVNLKKVWGGFEISPGVKAKRVIVNSLGAARTLGKMNPKFFRSEISHWLYFDRIQCALEDLPDPLGEDVLLRSSSGQTIHLFVERDRLRDQARITMGVWLSFMEARDWPEEIEKAREAVRQFLPFLPKQVWRSIPESLELTEMKGECIRRGEVERLVFRNEADRGLGHTLRHALSQLAAKAGIGRRDYFVLPYLDQLSDRSASLGNCLTILDFFDRKVAKKAAGLA